MKNIMVVGARGYHTQYGGWETFVTNLIDNYNDKNVKFHVAELTHVKGFDKKVIRKDDVSSLEIYVPKLGFVTMFVYAIKALWYLPKYMKENNLDNLILYVLGCRVGPFYHSLIKRLKKLGVKVYLNPDGLEWKREKWAWWIKQCFKISEYFMVKHSDVIVCDARAIKDYIETKYEHLNKETVFIPYGAYLDGKKSKNKIVEDLFKKYKIKEDKYYLIVGRFVPENNYELIIREFMKTKVKKDLVIVSNVEENKFYDKLKAKTNFLTDKRIKFVGSVYDKEGLNYIRSKAYAYIHGHSAGGTNPSLLEAMTTTSLNILYNAIYNVEVGGFAGLYFGKQEDSLKKLIEKVEKFDIETIKKYEDLAKERVKEEYTWKLVVDKYKNIW